MKKIVLSVVLLFPLLAQCQLVKEIDHSTKTLIWSEEFNYSGLPDDTKWNFEVGKARANNEPQYHTKDLKNVRVEDGNLIITAWLDQPWRETRPAQRCRFNRDKNDGPH